jgi:hypothetical protein
MKLRHVFACAILSMICGAGPAQAAFHFWQIKEVYSNADGSVQFIEMFDNVSFEHFIGGYSLEADDGSPLSFTFPTNLPMANNTNGRHILIATPGFAALPGAVTPDYTLPAGPFFNPNAATITISFDGSGDFMTFSGAQLPKNGINSLTNIGGTPTAGTNSPTNFNNQAGSLVPEPTIFILAIAAPVIAALHRRRRTRNRR